LDGRAGGARRAPLYAGLTNVIVLLSEALKGMGATDKKLIQAHTKGNHHSPIGPPPYDQAPPYSEVSDLPLG
jgi:hypothetical protein